jgi:hypothetical protein
MAALFCCKNCHELKPVNYRLKDNQEYCSAAACQRARKAAWQKNKMATDLNYRGRQKECLRRWRKARPLDQYQKQYRLQHPEYVAKNRQLQRIRYKKRLKSQDDQKIVKMDALKSPSEKPNTYLMNPYKVDASGKIVKMDALIVQLTDLQANNDHYLPLFP